MQSKKNTINHLGPWAQRQRLEHISRILYWRGWIRRIDLTSFYGISPQQASADLVVFQTLQPGACYYDTHRKRYEAAKNFQPGLFVPDAIADLKTLGFMSENDISLFEEPERPQRVCITETACQLVRNALAHRSIEIQYYSLSSGAATWRRIVPCRFVFDGLRLHVRAWCFQNEAYRDFVIGRISSTRKPLPLDTPLKADTEWESFVNITLRPAEGLGGNQRTALEMDYGMKNGVLQMPVRKAMLLYFRRRLGFSDEGSPVKNSNGELELIVD